MHVQNATCWLSVDKMKQINPDVLINLLFQIFFKHLNYVNNKYRSIQVALLGFVSTSRMVTPKGN